MFSYVTKRINSLSCTSMAFCIGTHQQRNAERLNAKEVQARQLLARVAALGSVSVFAVERVSEAGIEWPHRR